MATKYVTDYLRFGRARFFEERSPEVPNEAELTRLEPLNQHIIDEEYENLSAKTGEVELDVLPGYFLPAIRVRMQSIVEG
ncbi:MAG: hypothetical protein M5R40_16975 [Anaerolineae bacterium]|nr:hypothetical protein [Anaerolineae bacterium]